MPYKHKFQRPGEQHPEKWRRDLNPEPMAGQNLGTSDPDRERFARTAYDHKDVHDMLQQMDDDILKGIPILAPGARLEQNATYIDLNDLAAGEFTAMADMGAGAANLYVPKNQVDYNIWNRLIGVRNPERLGLA